MPTATTKHYSDPQEYGSSIRASRITVLVKDRGPFNARLTKIDLDRLWMQQGITSSSVVERSVTTPSRTVIFFLSDLNQAPVYHTGRLLRPGEIMFNSHGAEHYHNTSSGYGWSAMSLTPGDFANASGMLAGREIFAPKISRKIRPPPALASRLVHLHGAAVRLAATVPDLLTQQGVAHALEQELVRAMVECITSDLEDDTAERRTTRLPVMRRFEAILEANRDRPLYLTEICAAIGASARTLRLHCLEHIGMSPHRYLALRRMNLVRRALMMADPARTTVTEIATDHGFWELGRFSVTYRRLFGEAPSITLRNSPRPAATIATGLPILP